MASAGSDDEQPQPPPHKWCACIPWKRNSPRGHRNPVAGEEEPEPRLQIPPAVQDTTEPEQSRRQETPRAGPEETPREAPAHGGITIGDPILPEINDPEHLNANSPSKGKEKVDEVPASDSSSDGVKIDGPGGPSNSDAILGVELDYDRHCIMCSGTTFRRHSNDMRLLKWSDACNHLVCDLCVAANLNSRSSGVPIPDEHQVECPVEGCTQMRTAGQCRAHFRGAVRQFYARLDGIRQ